LEDKNKMIKYGRELYLEKILLGELEEVGNNGLSEIELMKSYDLGISRVIDGVVGVEAIQPQEQIELIKKWKQYKIRSDADYFLKIYNFLKYSDLIKTKKQLFGKDKVQITSKGLEYFNDIKEIAGDYAAKEDIEYLKKVQITAEQEPKIIEFEKIGFRK